MSIPAGMENEFDSQDEDMVFSHISEKNDINDLTNSPNSSMSFEMPSANSTKVGSSDEKVETPPIRGTTPTRIGARGSHSILLNDLRVAVMQGNLNSVKAIIEKDVFADSILKAGWTALMHACSCGHHEIVAYLLEKKADPNYHKDLFTPLMAVCASRKETEQNLVKCVEHLLEYGAKVNVKERHHMTPLLFACREGRTLVAQKLVEKGADVNCRDNRGWSPLAWASSGGYGQIVRLLLNNKGDPSIVALNGQTAADVAYAHGHDQIGELLDQQQNQTGDVKPLSRQTTNKIISNTVESNNSRQSINYGDLELFLSGLGYSELISLFRDNELSFRDLLVISDQELEKIGIEKLGVRKKILEEIHAVHKTKWQKSSLPNLEQQKYLSCVDAVTMMANISKHLAYIGGTIVYLRQQIQAHPRIMELSQQSYNVRHLIQEAEQGIKNSKLLHEELRFLVMHLNKVQDNAEYIPADLITETATLPKPGSFRFRSRTILFLGITALLTAVGSMWWKYPQSLTRFLFLPNILQKIKWPRSIQ